MDRQGYQRAAPRAGEGGNPAGTGADYGKFHDRLDEIAARLDRLARRAQTRAPAGANVLRLVRGPARFTARMLPGGAVEFTFAGDAARLARDPALYRYRYGVG